MSDQYRELDPLRDMARTLNDEVDLPTRMSTPSQQRGGYIGVKPSQTIACDGCWCGEPQGHDWPFKEAGAAHPR